MRATVVGVGTSATYNGDAMFFKVELLVKIPRGDFLRDGMPPALQLAEGALTSRAEVDVEITEAAPR